MKRLSLGGFNVTRVSVGRERGSVWQVCHAVFVGDGAGDSGDSSNNSEILHVVIVFQINN